MLDDNVGLDVMGDWGQADTLRLQKLQAGMTEVRSQVDDGMLSPEEGAGFEQQIAPQLQQMTMRQQQAMQQRKQRAVQEAMHDMALQEAVQQQNTRSRASDFTNSIGTVTDPLTGKRASFYPFKPNEWKQVEFPEDAEPSGGGDNQGTAGGDVGTAYSTDQPADVGDDRTMTIWNGPHKSVITFDENGKIVSQAGSTAGMTPNAPGYQEALAREQAGIPKPGQEDVATLNPHEIQQLRKTAMALHPQANYRTPQEWNQAVNASLEHFAGLHLREKQAAITARRTAERDTQRQEAATQLKAQSDQAIAQRQEQADLRKQQAEERKAQAKEAETTRKQSQERLATALQKEEHELTAQNNRPDLGDQPKKTPDQIKQEARDNVVNRFRAVGMDTGDLKSSQELQAEKAKADEQARLDTPKVMEQLRKEVAEDDAEAAKIKADPAFQEARHRAVAEKPHGGGGPAMDRLARYMARHRLGRLSEEERARMNELAQQLRPYINPTGQ